MSIRTSITKKVAEKPKKPLKTPTVEVNIPDWLNYQLVDPDIHQSFVYRIDQLDEEGNIYKSYIGKKNLVSTITKKLTKKELEEMPVKPGRRATKKKVTTESDWKSYFGSSKELKDEVKKVGYGKFKRTILYLCMSRKQATYLEMYEQFTNRVLENPDKWYNANIEGKLFCKDCIGYIKL